MVKRAVEDGEANGIALKKGERPVKTQDEDEMGEFEDDYEDEYESEEEIFEAGVDGRPDADGEAERKGTLDHTGSTVRIPSRIYDGSC